MNRDEIEAELVAWMERPWLGDARCVEAGGRASQTADDEGFERLALALFGFQYAHCQPYARLCRSLERTPADVHRSDEVPAVPTGAFKEFDLRCFEPTETRKTFRTSGTSSDRRGRLHLDTLRLYEASLLSSLRACFLTDLTGQRPVMRFLAPPPTEAPDSSLSHMFATLLEAEGGEGSGFDLAGGHLDLARIARAAEDARRTGAPLLLAGTSFAFVHFLDATQADPGGAWSLPPGSRIMETGGFKGRSREIPRETLRAGLAERFDVPQTSVINQYGMTELGSQFYDSTLVDPHGPRRKLAPPWTRVRMVDPDAGREVDPGEVGLVVIHDLANTGSIASIQTADLGRVVRPLEPGSSGARASVGFDLLGRAEGAEQRGCSIAADVMLEAADREATG